MTESVTTVSNNKTIGTEKQARAWIPEARRAGVAAIVGGGLLAADIIWQGILDLRVGGDAMLHDPTTIAYWVSSVALFLSAALLMVGFIGLWAHTHKRMNGRLWTTGVWLTAIALGATVVGSAVPIGLALIGQIELAESVGAIYGIGSLLMWIGAFPLGMALLRANMMRPAAILFTAALPLLIVGIALSSVNSAVTGLFMATVAFAWIVAGYTLRSHSTSVSSDPNVPTV